MKMWRELSSTKAVTGAALLLCIALSGGAAAGSGLDAGYRQVYENAYRAMTNGQAFEGAVALVEMMRTVPGDDASIADSLVGPWQLLGFAYYYLFDWPNRTDLETEVLKPDEYVSDKLFMAVMDAGSGDQGKAGVALYRLEGLSKSEHLAVRVVALYIVGEPYFFGGEYAQKPAVAEMVLNYPNLDFRRCIIEMPVYYTLDAARKADKSDQYLLENVIYWGGRKEMVLEASPGLAKAAEALPSMNLRDLNDAVITRWAEGLASDPNPDSRYTVVSLLAKTCYTPARRECAKAGLEALANQPPTTPDVLRARVLLAEFAREDHEPKALQGLAQDLLRLGIPPCTPERSMYEAIKETAQHAARYYTRLGWHTLAIQMHEALAAKFPGSALAEKELEKADALRTD